MSFSIKTIRQNIGLTQEQVAKLTGVPVKTLRNWEQEIRKPSDWTLDLVVDRLLRIKLEEQLQIDDSSGILSFLTIKEEVSVVAEKYDVSKIYLFGSYVKGEASENSDIDLYKGERYHFAKLMGDEWFRILRKLEQKIGQRGIDDLKKEMEGRTFVGEYCGN